MTTAIAEVQRKFDELDTLASEFSLTAIESSKRFHRAMILADGIAQFRKAMTPEILARFMQLQNSKLGFLTDKKEGYPIETVRECMIEAILRGANPVGNEFNIIAGNVYLAQAFYVRKVLEFPGLKNLEEFPGIPRMVNGGAVVDYKLTWKINGEPSGIDRSGATGIPVRVNSGMIVDAIIGKSRRKIFCAAYCKLTGTDPGADGDDGIIDGQPSLLPSQKKSDAVADKLGAKPALPTEANGKQSATAETIKASIKDRLDKDLESSSDGDTVQDVRDKATLALQGGSIEQAWYDGFLERSTDKIRSFRTAKAKKEQPEFAGVGNGPYGQA